MAILATDWLKLHDGELRRAPDSSTWLVLIGGSPQYKLTPTPADGKHACLIVQAINTKRVDKGRTYATADDALQGGLDELRGVLGW